VQKFLFYLILLCCSNLVSAQELHLFYANGKAGFKNSEDAIVIQATLEAASQFMGNYAIAMQNNKKGLIKKDGTWQIPAIYNDIVYNGNEHFFAKKDSVFYLINLQQDIVIPQAIQKAYLPQNNIAKVYVNNAWRFVNVKAGYFLKNSYDNVGDFSYNKAPVCSNGLWGFVDETGKLVINYQYIYASSFNNYGQAMVTNNQVKSYYINTSGKKLNKKIPEAPKDEEEQYQLNKKMKK
jgi:hypothetical protein